MVYLLLMDYDCNDHVARIEESKRRHTEDCDLTIIYRKHQYENGRKINNNNSCIILSSNSVTTAKWM